MPVDDKLDIDKIVDPEIKKIFKRAIKEEKISLKEMAKQGGLIYTDPKNRTNQTYSSRKMLSKTNRIARNQKTNIFLET